MQRVEWRDNPPPDSGEGSVRRDQSGSRMLAENHPIGWIDHRRRVALMARSDHRVEKMVDRASGSGGRLRPPDAERGSLPPEPLTHAPT
jgi:hypothetical protein